MNYAGTIASDMTALLLLFKPYCDETETLNKLLALTTDPDCWQKAHTLFGQIRDKTLKANQSKSRKALTQYMFEEACAKTLHNLGTHSSPFDPDSPYWIVPTALLFAKYAGIEEQRVLKCVGQSLPDAFPALKAL